jgi:hypothetical protein
MAGFVEVFRPAPVMRQFRKTQQIDRYLGGAFPPSVNTMEK